MPNLQDHMLRVTAVAFKICDNFEKEVDKHSIITATLLHDIGNMVKFRLEAFPEFLKPKGLEYWRKAQEEFINKYGKNDYQATYRILKEMKVEPSVYKLIQSMEFRKAPINIDNSNYETKICQYSDLRVAPFGITSLDDRLREVQDRFMRNKGISEKEFLLLSSSMRTIEEQIFSQCKIRPVDINDANLKSLIDKLRDLDI